MQTRNQNEVIINVTGLIKKYGDLTAVNNLSFEIYKGEIFGFLGPNGAGKTTAINIICGLMPATAGEIIIAGDKNMDRQDVKSLIGICPQENIFWPKLTCLEQLVFMGEMYDMPAKMAKTRAKQLLHWLGLEDKTNVMAIKLSGGMKRRLNLCLALIHDPEILVLDEPEAGLDPQSRILVRDFIKNLAPQKTIILTTHNMDEADRLADRVAIIDHGQLLRLDTPSHLKKSTGEGDILEITLADSNIEQLPSLTANLARKYDHIKLTNNTLIIKARNLIETITDITTDIKNSGLKINEISMRENTLEDVFIDLTGRKLRQ